MQRRWLLDVHNKPGVEMGSRPLNSTDFVEVTDQSLDFLTNGDDREDDTMRTGKAGIGESLNIMPDDQRNRQFGQSRVGEPWTNRKVGIGRSFLPAGLDRGSDALVRRCVQERC